MADNDNVVFHQQLLSIDENLGKDDVEDMKFLCSDFITLKKLETVKSAQDIFLFLINEDLINKDDTFLIAELLYIIGNNFLLPKLGYTKEIVQEELLKRRKVSGYRQLLYEITQDLTMDNVKNAAFLLKNYLPKKQPIMSALELLTSLEKKDLLMESNLSILEYICGKTAPHLLKKIEMYKQAKVPHQGIKETDPSSVCAFNKPTFGNISFQDPVLPKNHEHLYNEQFGSLQEHIGNVCSLAANLDVKAEPVFDSLKQGLQRTVRENDTNAEAVVLSQYKMDGQCRGYCLIINNVNFEGDLKKRNGSEKDAMELKHVFTWLGFKVKKYDDKTSTEIEKLLEFWQSSKDWKDSDCLVCCILSHGKSGKIFGTDECLIPIRTITSYFKANRCPLLAQKPKLFFIQACQGEKTQQPAFLQEDTGHAASFEPDAQSSGFVSSQQLTSSIPDEADFLLGMATVDGYLSFRHVLEGTWYIQALCSKLQLLVPRGEDLLSILTEVNEEVSKRADPQRERKQMPQPAYTLRKKLIFPVPNKPFVPSEQSSDMQ
ncbi:caspase-10 isoform X2 [Pituophis catenifer annectens]